MRKIELLAPAGDLTRAKIAIKYGADAVYIGGKSFSLRSRASNFDIEDIKEAVSFAKQYQAKIYVTVNIIPHQEDLHGVDQYLKQLEQIGVSAVICSSIEIIKTAKRVAPKLEVHLSTQQSVTNSEAIAFYQDLGVDRVVLARELSMIEISKTNNNSPLPLEVFIHGGMCANYSGRCTISNFMTLRDANRGGCAHSCRWFYHLFDGEKQLTTAQRLFTLAATDLIALEQIPELIDMNIVSLKIEGRMKSAYYIASVVKTYRLLIDEYYQEKKITEERMNWYKKEMVKAENRLASSGYLEGLPQEDPQAALRQVTASQEYLGTVVNVTNDRLLLEVRNRFEKGDLVEVLSQSETNKTFVVNEIIDEEGQALIVCNRPMQKVWITVPFKVDIDDMLRRGERT
jgi:putative protease